MYLSIHYIIFLDVDWETVHTSSLSVTLQDKVSSDVDKTPDDLICNGDKDKNMSENIGIDKVNNIHQYVYI